MTKKEIIILICACLAIGLSIYFGFTLLFPSDKSNDQSSTNSNNVEQVSSEIDETTYKTVNTLSDYGKPELSGVGKSDLFAGF